VAFVLDASIVLKWFVEDEMSPDADKLLDRVRSGGAVVPALFRWEAQNVLVQAVRNSRLTVGLADLALEELAALPIAVEHPGEKLFFGGETALALHYDLTPYDAAYVAVALDYRLELATADSELAKAARDAGVHVIHVR
jgi:predicted nucleic acid-binding protein